MDYIVERIKSLMEEKGYSASEFADAIGVNKATLSHVLSGRNKPSLEFVLRIIENFDDVQPDFLMRNVHKDSLIEINDKAEEAHNASGLPENDISVASSNRSQKAIDRIVIFYKDHSFTEYRNDYDS